ncbi:hypothetical protein RGU12_09560 [Fredinandcohnia sp. QZ13]|uniref:hypothetical protein n=1 Tax=Fredinandcohnia sp. QZ13 TaxID=3073144 RepID=UPI00285349CA|nr:hypothetical protein [Fredinandcohnia sp. QZ13]MDR4887791.1 hypothetical protein [Fredinandcohnia sp. QZ13]
MKYIKMLLLPFFIVFTLSFIIVGNTPVSADHGFDETYEQHDDEDGIYEDVGKAVGWGTAITLGAAGFIFPIRRSMKWLISNYPKSKKTFISTSKFFGKYHILIGILALALSIIHGVTMYVSEGELESDGIIGLVAVVLMIVASLFGLILSKNKKEKKLRNTHMTLIAFTLFIVFVHIIL